MSQLDKACQKHDCAYKQANGNLQHLQQADQIFFEETSKLGTRGKIYGAAVKYINAMAREPKLRTTSTEAIVMPGGTVRFTPTRPVTRRSNPPRPRPKQYSISQRAAPASLGSVLTASEPVLIHAKEGLAMRGIEFIDFVSGQGASVFQTDVLFPIHPAWFGAGRIGVESRAYAEYKFRTLRFRYIPASTTAVNYSVLMSYNKDNLSPQPNSTSSYGYLSRQLATGQTVLTSTWIAAEMVVPLDEGWRHIQALSSVDVNDHLSGELVVAIQDASAGTQFGYVVMEYDIAFRTLQLQLHQGLYPLPTSCFGIGTFTDSAVSVNNNACIVTSTSGDNPLPIYTLGTVFKCILNLSASTLVTNTAANNWKVVTQTPATTTTLSTNTSAITMVNGMCIWMVLETTTTGVFYATLDTAVKGGIDGSIAIANSGAGQSAYRLAFYYIHAGGNVVPSQNTGP